MIVSKLKKLIPLAALSLVIATFSASAATECPCKNNKTIKIKECKSTKANSPSWWDWIISNKSSQFHFFQLLELIHNGEVGTVPTSTTNLSSNNANV